jgi:hypothetical protein
MSTTERTLSDDALLPSPAGAGAGAGQPAIAPWLATEDQRLTSHVTPEQRTWMLAVCEASHAGGATLTPTGLVRAGVQRLMDENPDPAAAAAALAAG